MHAAVHMRTHSNALHSCPPNASQRALSRSPTPSRGPPRRSPTNDTGRCSVSSQPLDDCSGWFSSSNQQGELSPADEWIQKATTEQSGGAGAGAGQADVLTHSTTLDQSERCTVRCITLSSPARGHLQSQENTRVKGLDASAAAQLNRIVEQSAPVGGSSGGLGTHISLFSNGGQLRDPLRVVRTPIPNISAVYSCTTVTC